MLKKVTAWTTSDGTVVASLEAAKEAELTTLINKQVPGTDTNPSGTAKFLVEHSAEVLDILTTGPSSLPSARAIHGGRKPRKAKADEAPQAAAA